MGTYVATIRWDRGDAPFLDNRYSRGHVWEFDGGQSVPASAAPSIVPEPMSVAANVDPEEAFVASLSSCHMLFFLSIARERGFVVDAYVDHAVGHMRKDEQGNIAVTRVVLRPDASYSGERTPDRDELEAMHHDAHRQCFIANSVRSDVITEIVN